MEQSETPKIGLYFLNVTQLPACFAPTQAALATLENIDIQPKVSMDDILVNIKSGKKCFLVLTVGDRNDLGVIANGLFSLKKEIKSRQVMAVAFMKFASDKVEDLLMRSGCSEVLKFDVSSKAFTYKLRRYLKLIEQEEASEAMVEIAGGKGNSREASAFQVVLTEEWAGQDDYWLFRKKVYAKKYQDKWLIEIIGPSPAAGSWENISEKRWRWKTRPGFDFFDPKPAVWEFVGQEPQYSWVINRWGFISENPSLNLIEAGNLIYSRFILRDPNTLEVPANSNFSRSIFQQIKDTYDRDHHFAADEGIPWADKTNSKDLSAADWNVRDQAMVAPGREVSGGDSGEFLMGAEAMANCGLHGKVKNYVVNMLEYDEAQSSLCIGLDSALVEYKEMIDVTVESENLSLPKGLTLRGIVTKIDEDESGLGKSIAVVLMLQSSKDEFKKIRDAVDKRQREVFAFFKKAKALE